ncbi:MAG: hypothetical protein HY665_07490 [Chloroflexi bacterium]|nr:hypothetical protein [Chloroflexota bacterium]
MKRYHGGNPVPKGVYVNLSDGEFVQLYGDIRLLPGGDADQFIKVPGGLAVLAAPVLGLVFIMFLPFTGLVGLLSFIAYKTRLASNGLGRKVFQPVLVGFRRK